MPRVRFMPDDLTVEAAPGSSLLSVAMGGDVFIEHACGGFCACTTCHVYVRTGFETLSEPTDAELDRLDFAEQLRPESRLACQARLGTADVTVEVPVASTYGGAHLTREERAKRGH